MSRIGQQLIDQGLTYDEITARVAELQDQARQDRIDREAEARDHHLDKQEEETPWTI